MRPIRLMLDSGAFSCFTQGQTIDVAVYTEFCQKNSENIDHVINLDVINPKGPEEAASAGWDNLVYMKDKGIDAIPVYHARESIKWFDKMLNTCPYIGVSGTSLVSPTEHLNFYDLAFTYGTDSNGFPIAKYHLFGDSSPVALLNYPAYSCDSATWMIQGGRAGSIKLKGKSFRIRSKTVCDANYVSADMMGPQKTSWEEECRYLGLKPDKVMTTEVTGSQMAMLRSYMVAADLLKLRDRSIDCTSFKQPRRLIATKKSLPYYRVSTKNWIDEKITSGEERKQPIELYFVISPSAYNFNFPVITALGIKNILVSYFYVSKEKKDFWGEKLVPFLHDPAEFCQTDPKTKIFWDKLNECLVNPISLGAAVV